MRTKHITIIIVCAMLAAFTLGATDIVHLVNASDGKAVGPDRLVGVLITREYLDLFDSEQFFQDNAAKLADGDKISEAKSAKYRGRLYATLIETTQTDGETGKTDIRKEYVFENTEGIPYFASQIADPSGAYWDAVGDDAIGDGHIQFHSTDEGESIILEGTIYASIDGQAKHFYMNPVYQTPDGEVYAVSGNGIFSDSRSAGVSMSHNIKENQSSTIGGQTAASGSEIKITICYMDEPANVSVLQFSGENELLSKTDYHPSDFPDALQTQPGTRYIIVETTTVSQDRTENLTREIYQSEDETLSVFMRRDDGIFVKKSCVIDWK